MPTLKDIAKRAQVDPSIVSRVLNKGDFARASPAVRERIEQAARELGYVPNMLARSLVRRKTDMVGLIIPDLYEPAFVRYFKTIEELFSARGIQVLPMFSRWSPEWEEKALMMVNQHLVDGVIAFFFEGVNQMERYAELKKKSIPVVFRLNNETLGGKEIDSVIVNLSEGAYVLTKHLFENGFERVALLGGFDASGIASGKSPCGLGAGYLRAHHEAGKAVAPRLAITCNHDGSDAYERLLERLEEKPGEIDSILVQSSSKLPGVYRALNRCGLKIGEDIGLVTITDSELCHLTDVPITVWEQPVREICSELVRLFLDVQQAPGRPPEHVSLHSSLLVRDSSQRRPAR